MWKASFADVHSAHDLDSAGDRAMKMDRHLQRFVQFAVDTIPHSQTPLRRLDSTDMGYDHSNPKHKRPYNYAIEQIPFGEFPNSGYISGRKK